MEKKAKRRDQHLKVIPHPIKKRMMLLIKTSILIRALIIHLGTLRILMAMKINKLKLEEI